MRRADLAAEATRVGVAHVIREDQKDIGPARVPFPRREEAGRRAGRGPDPERPEKFAPPPGRRENTGPPVHLLVAHLSSFLLPWFVWRRQRGACVPKLPARAAKATGKMWPDNLTSRAALSAARTADFLPAMDLSELLRPLLEFDAPLLANTLGYIDSTPPDQIYLGGSIQCLTPQRGSMVGVAMTCEMDTSSPGGTPDADLYYTQLEEMQKSGLPTVWVVKAVGSRPDHECIIGDGMAKTLGSVGCRGLVTDGGLRDLEGMVGLPFHVFGRGRVVHHTAIRVRRINEPVEIGGLVVRNGDILHGSDDGVVRIPRASLEALPERAAQMRAFEHEAHFIFRDPGLPPREKPKRVRELLVRYGFAK
jgi:regulator of RNase E activity RraA